MSSDQPNNKRSNESSTISSNAKKKARKSSLSDSPSRAASNCNGKNDILRNKRSVVYHQFGLMLVGAVAKIESRSISEKFEALMIEMFPECQESIKNINDMRDENCFAECYANWRGKEKVLTKSLVDRIEQTNVVKNAKLKVSNYKSVPFENSWGLPDILISDDTSPVMVIEVGLDNKDFWKKFNQASMYINGLLCGSQSKSQSPILLTVLTISTNPKLEQFEARLGMFLFVRCLSNDEEYRVILIWRKKYSSKLIDLAASLAPLSKSFSTVLSAASFLSELRDSTTMYNCKILGPNCCLIDNKVLRAYDDRMLKTQRRPDIYLQGVTDVVDPADVLCDLTDENLTTENQQFEIENEGNKNQMWKFEGRLLVISTPFHKGRHWAVSPTDFVPIIDQLRKLHENGFVHGDIRGSNMVIFSEEYGKLIDFDFGGKIDVNKPQAVAYPVGYSQDLFDGSRRGVAGEPITMDDDWYALIKFIFHFHDFHPPQSVKSMLVNPTANNNLPMYLLVARQNQLENTFIGQSEEDLAALARNLISFLSDIKAQSWKVMPSPKYKKNLEMYGCKKGSDPSINERKSSKLATGSPPNDRL